ncbi:MAG: hypothetical protein LCH39_08880 [Proteobacteria bacterium]|nr:hypothetical protein [Pseudomonadota bacterium]
MIQSVSSATSVAALNVAANAPSKAVAAKAAAAQGQSAAPVAQPANPKAVEALKSMNARAYLERQQIAAALYDRSFTYDEGIKALKRQDAIAAYAARIQAKAGGPTEADLAKLAKKLDNAAKQIDRLSNNKQGADLDSVAAVDGKPVDDTQANLAARIKAGLNDGSLTEAEAKVLVEQQDKIAELEKGLRESGGKLTAGEQKIVLDELRKSADALNKARNNKVGTPVSSLTYEQSVTNRQAALQKQLEQGVKIGALTADEAKQVQAQFEKVAALKGESMANGSINWREAVALSSAMNEAEAQIYDLQRNAEGKKLAEVFVNEKYVDERQTGQLEGITRGLDNRSLTNEEAETLLAGQKAVDAKQADAAQGGLTRSEYLRLQSTMNDQSLLLNELATNKARYTGLTPPAATVPGAPVPAAPVPPKVAAPAPAPAPAAPAAPAASAAEPAKPEPKPEAAKPAAPQPEPASPAAQQQAALKAETAPTTLQINRELAQHEDKMGKRLASMLADLNDRVGDWAKEVRERADAHKAQTAEHGRVEAKDKPRAAQHEAPVSADIVAKVAAYAKVEAGPVVPAQAKKVA